MVECVLAGRAGCSTKAWKDLQSSPSTAAETSGTTTGHPSSEEDDQTGGKVKPDIIGETESFPSMFSTFKNLYDQGNFSSLPIWRKPE